MSGPASTQAVFDAGTRVDLGRFWQTIGGSAEIGKGRVGGLARLSLTDSDKVMRDLFVSWCKQANLKVTIDELCNVFARRDGLSNDEAPIMIGSHLDTQINGGRFDGIAGVLAGLEVCKTLEARGYVTKRPIVVVNWTNEEGARFSPPMVASGCFTGRYTADWVRDRIADDGCRFGDELERIGYRGPVPCGNQAVDAYFELHIEQGPLLDAGRKQIGVVTDGLLVHGMMVEFTGETAHTGPWPMEKRRNALVAGARWLTAVDDIGWDFAGSGGKATAARLSAWPNKPGILSETALGVCDVRHEEPTVARVMVTRMRRAAQEAAIRSGCDMRIVDEWSYGGDIFDADLVSLVRGKAGAMGYDWIDISSQASHDAYFMAEHCPAVMIFVPCKDGITHNSLESCEIEDFDAGVNLLLHAVVDRADR